MFKKAQVQYIEVEESPPRNLKPETIVTTIPVAGPTRNPPVPNQFRKQGIHMADPGGEWLIRFPGPGHNRHDKNAPESVLHLRHLIRILRSCLDHLSLTNLKTLISGGAFPVQSFYGHSRFPILASAQ